VAIHRVSAVIRNGSPVRDRLGLSGGEGLVVVVGCVVGGVAVGCCDC
jgi:hypothetical protein